MSSTWTPEFLIAIDFGMTCSGVSYSFGPEWPDPKVMQSWPGQYGNTQLANKVTTQVSYQTDVLQNWGFLCDYGPDNDLIVDFFKLYLNPRFNDTFPDRPTRKQAIRYFQDFMRCLYQHIQTSFEQSWSDWDSRNVEFLFSIPTTWKDPGLSVELEGWLRQAGFGSRPAQQRINIFQTEAEAAAVYAAKTQFKEGDVVLVCDAGGGTTDVNILQVTLRKSHGTELRGLNKAEGIDAGGALIDQDVEQLLVQELKRIAEFSGRNDLHRIARIMIRSQFEPFKKAFGGQGTNLPSLILRIPDMPHKTLSIATAKLKDFFDRQVARICEGINQQLGELERQHPTEHVAYLVLSGGLGSSPYVKHHLKAKYEMQPLNPNAQRLKILNADEPQLAVVKGLIMERRQALIRGGRGIYLERCCRNSYGVVYRQPYDTMKHTGEKVTIDPLDGRRWAEDQIDWLIKEGEVVPVDGIKRDYKLKIPLDRTKEVWKATIVMSENEATDLPRSLRSSGARTLCIVRSTFPERDFKPSTPRHSGSFKLMNKQWFKKSPQYFLAEFVIAVEVGSTDLKFRLMSKDGRTYSRDHEELEVQFAPPKTTTAVGETMNQMYRAEDE